ncbi:MAG: hypothetical protein EBU93_01780 [Chlamydiae bacterium]|nr:hypothetical protein [Chlamydiota bacterium]
MLTKKTCLVLGAGASAESGLPSGRDLIYLISKEAAAARDQPGSLYFHAFDRITSGRLSNTRLRDSLDLFSALLERSYSSSIDEFIVTNQTPYFKEIAKLGIAIVLNRFESSKNLFELEDYKIGRNETKSTIQVPRKNWYQQIWNRINSGCNNLDQLKTSLSNIKIITFNYDRSLEQFLYSCALNTYVRINSDAFGFPTNNESDIETVFRHYLQVNHVYGQIGRLSWQNEVLGGQIPYGLNFFELKTDQIRAAIEISESISTLQEIKDHSDAQNQLDWVSISKDFTDASSIHFLGFGYHPQNMRFFSNEFLNCSFSNEYSPRIGGTCMGISKPRQSEIKFAISNWAHGQIDLPDLDLLNFVECDISDYFNTYF